MDQVRQCDHPVLPCSVLTISHSLCVYQTIRIWNVKTGECLRTLRDHDHVIETIEFSNSVASETYLKAFVSVVSVWHVFNAVVTGVFWHSQMNNSSAPADAKQGNHSVQVRSPAAPTAVSCMVLAADANGVEAKLDPALKDQPAQGLFLVSGARDKTIRVWEVSTGRCVKVLVCALASCQCNTAT